jgi:hypothetical protein
LIVLAGVLAFDSLAIASVYWYVRESRTAVEEQRLALEQRPRVSWRENAAEPIVRPAVLKAADAKLRPDDFVIGVEFGGKTRAYRLGAFENPMGHLVNDMIDGVAVSIAYCDLTRCVRVYTDPAIRAPLDLQVAGMLNREMVIKFGGSLYFQRSGKALDSTRGLSAIPYALVTPALVTWSDWARDHPETDVYVGDRGPLRKENMVRAIAQ